MATPTFHINYNTEVRLPWSWWVDQGQIHVTLLYRYFTKRYSSTGSHSTELLDSALVYLDAPLNEFLYLHELPPGSPTLETVDWATDLVHHMTGWNLSSHSDDVNRNVRRLIVEECNYLLLEQPPEAADISNETNISIYVDFCSQVRFSEQEINPTLEESFDEASLERFVVDLETCTICMGHMEHGDRGARMPCKHVYHEECILQWLRSSSSCPICRFELP